MINSNYSVFYIKWQGNFLPVGCIAPENFTENADMIDVNRNNLYKSSMPTNQGYNVSFDGLIKDTNSVNGDSSKISLDRLVLLKRGRSLIEWKTEDDNEVLVEGGFGYITSLNKSSNIDEFISFTCNIEGFGAPYSISLTDFYLQNELQYRI
tara:strand:- start:557 stop:1012 length:456 start_codon:yes stop_codon:yes gene_type:complete